MRIGALVQSGRVGHSYLSKNFIDAFLKKHEVFLFATRGVKEEWGGIWKDYNTEYHSEMNYLNIDHSVFVDWVKRNNLDLVFFNEVYDWYLVAAVKKVCKVITYVDWFSRETLENFRMYDKLIICAPHTYELFFSFHNARYIPFGIKTELFKPQEGEKMDFFHNAGWGGINNRKCTPEIVKAIYKGKGTLYLHTQTNVFDGETQRRIKELRGERLGLHYGSVEPPGLYHKGRIYLGVSKLEGLGLYLPEALSCGLPVITTDAPPMNYWVNEERGLLVKIKDKKQREDGYYFPEYKIDEKDLAEKIKWALENPEEMKKKGEMARNWIIQNHSFEKFAEEVNNTLEEV